MTPTPQIAVGLSPAERRASRSRSLARSRLFRLDGGYVVLHQDAVTRGPQVFAAAAAPWRGHHVIAIAAAPQDASEWSLAELGRAAQAFDRVVICQSCDPAAPGPAEAAARFARAVRSAGRTECHLAADAHRALRHCVDAMIPGDVIAYCCEDVDAAARILAEYGATPVREGARQRPDPAKGAHAALGGINSGELTAAHA